MALINQPPQRSPVTNKSGTTPIDWISWFQQVFNLLSGMSLAGTTAQRPTTNLWIGQPYFNTDHMAPEYVSSVSPVSWVPAANGNLSFTWPGGSSRPSPPQLYQSFFDATLGQPIWCANTSPVKWVNAAGVQV